MSRNLELAFLHADACSFSAAMAISADLTLKRLKAGQTMFERTSHSFGGRIVNMVGDSVLMAFDSVEGASYAAAEITDHANAARNAETELQPFDYRLGLTTGRVIEESGQLYGHCINMAARIGSLVGRGNLGVERKAWPRARLITAGAQVRERILFAKPDEPSVDFFEVVTTTRSDHALGGVERSRNEPVIALLPLFPRSTDQINKMQSDLLDAFVWDCNGYFASFGWRVVKIVDRGDDVDVSDIAADYIVRCRATVLPIGSRLAVELRSKHVRQGAQSFVRDTDETSPGLSYALALTSLVGSAIAHAERERVANTRGVGSHQLVAAGRECIGGFSAAQFSVGMDYLRAAQRIDPEYPLLLSSLARAHAVAWRFGWLDRTLDHLEIAKTLASKAVKLAPNDARSEADLGFVKLWANEPVDSAWHYERSLDVLPYHPELAADAGMVFGYIGKGEKAATVLEKSIANLPFDADYRLWSLGDVYHSKRDYKNSLKWLSRMADQSQAQRLMAANKVRLGLDPTQHVQNVLALQPDFSVQRWVNIQPFTNEEDRVDFAEALLLAGLPA